MVNLNPQREARVLGGRDKAAFTYSGALIVCDPLSAHPHRPARQPAHILCLEIHAGLLGLRTECCLSWGTRPAEQVVSGQVGLYAAFFPRRRIRSSLSSPFFPLPLLASLLHIWMLISPLSLLFSKKNFFEIQFSSLSLLVGSCKQFCGLVPWKHGWAEGVNSSNERTIFYIENNLLKCAI